MNRGMLIATVIAIAFAILWFAYLKDVYIEGQKNAEMLKTEGWKSYDQNKVDEAAKKFSKAIEKDKKFAAAHFGLGSCYNQQGDYVKARDCFAKTLELKPDYYSARISYARCLVRLSKNRVESFRYIKEELQKIPTSAFTDANVAYNLASLYSVHGNVRDALNYLSYAINIVPAMRDDVKKDRDFDSIRDNQQFKRLVE